MTPGGHQHTAEDRFGTRLLDVLPAGTTLAELQPLTHAVIVARHAGAILVVFNRHKQHWELPGGIIDPGETPAECAARELQEESGITHAAAALRLACATRIAVSRDAGSGRIEYGAIYAADVEPPPAFTPGDEIAAIAWWDPRGSMAGLSPVDEALARAAREHMRG